MWVGLVMQCDGYKRVKTRPIFMLPDGYSICDVVTIEVWENLYVYLCGGCVICRIPAPSELALARKGLSKLVRYAKMDEPLKIQMGLVTSKYWCDVIKKKSEEMDIYDLCGEKKHKGSYIIMSGDVRSDETILDLIEKGVYPMWVRPYEPAIRTAR